MGSKRPLGRFFFELRGEVDKEWIYIDGSYVRAHQHASGARIGQERAIGKSAGGPSTKIHMPTNAHENPIYFEITGSEIHDVSVAPMLIEKVTQDAHSLIADKGYDSQEVRNLVQSKGVNPIIPRRQNSRQLNPKFDSYLYKSRHLIENFFARLKHFRSIATRFEKLARNFKAIIWLACSLIWLKLCC